jgi:hypothetical protein
MAHEHLIYDDDPHFIIDPDTREIVYESNEKVVLIQNDHNSERFTFDLPKIIDGHDMSTCNAIQVHYVNVGSGGLRSTGVYEILDIQESDADKDILVCSWLIARDATTHVGSLSFILRFACTSEGGVIEYDWHTAMYTGITISQSIDNIIEEDAEYVDSIEALRSRILEAGDKAISDINETKDSVYEFVSEAIDDDVDQKLESFNNDVDKKLNSFFTGDYADFEWSDGAVWEADDYWVFNGSARSTKDFIPVEPHKTLSIRSTTADVEVSIYEFDRDKNVIDIIRTTVRPISPSESCEFFKLLVDSSFGKVPRDELDNYVEVSYTAPSPLSNKEAIEALEEQHASFAGVHRQLSDEIAKINEDIVSGAGVKTSEGGEILNDYTNNKAVGTNSIAMNSNNVAGLRGYKILRVDTASNALVLDSIYGLEVGDVVSYSIFDSAAGGWRPGIDNNIIAEVNTILNRITLTNAIDGVYDGITVESRLAYRLSVREKPWLGTDTVSARAFAAGRDSIASGDGSAVFGRNNKAKGDYSLVLGRNGAVTGEASFAANVSNTVEADAAYADGWGNYVKKTATGAHAGGNGTIATTPFSRVGGTFNKEDTEQKYLEIIGNGSSNSSRGNARTLDKQGNAWYAGEVYVGSTRDKLQTERDTHEALVLDMQFIKGNTVLTNVSGNNTDYSSTVIDSSWEKYIISDYIPVGLLIGYRITGLESYIGASIYPITFHRKDKSFIGAYSPTEMTNEVEAVVDFTDELLNIYKEAVYIRIGRNTSFNFSYKPIGDYKIEALQESTSTNYKDVERLEKEVEMLKAAAEGNSYVFQTDDTTANVKAIPSNALPYAVLEKVEGRTLAFDETQNLDFVPVQLESITIKGKNLLNTNSFVLGSIDSNTGATNTVYYILRLTDHMPIYGDKSYTLSCSKGYDLRHIYFYDADKNFISAVWMNRVQKYTVTAPTNVAYFNVCFEPTGVSSSTKFTDEQVSTIKGECKVQAEYGETATEYTPYIEPITYTIPDAVKNLPYYGYATDYVSNYIDFEKKQYVQMCETSGYKDSFYDENGSIKDGIKHNMSHTEFCIPLEEPIVTDISKYLTFDNTFAVQGGGTVEFGFKAVGNSDYGNGFLEYDEAAPSTITYQVKL